MSSNHLGSLLRRNPRLQQLHEQARKLQQLQGMLERQLPPTLRGHCRVAALEQGVLTLHVDSPAWAAKLRFLTADIMKLFHDSNTSVSVSTIRIKARPPEVKPRERKPDTRISPRTARFLRDVAETIEDPQLRASLRRLSEN